MSYPENVTPIRRSFLDSPAVPPQVVASKATPTPTSGGPTDPPAKQLKWEDLFVRGTLMVKHCGNWQATASLTDADLGLPPAPAARAKAGLRPRIARLADSGVLSAIHASEAKADAALKRYGLNFELLRSCYYVPNDRMPALQAELDRAQADRASAVRALVAEYEEIKAKMEPTLRAALSEICRSPESADKAFAITVAQYPSAGELGSMFSLTIDPIALTTGALGAAKDESKRIESTVREMVRGLREDLADRLQSTIALARKNAKLNKRTIEDTIAVVARVEDLNRMVGDPALRDQCRILRQVLAGAEGANTAGLLPSFEAAQKAMTGDLAAATIAAIDSLTSMGKRQIG